MATDLASALGYSKGQKAGTATASCTAAGGERRRVPCNLDYLELQRVPEDGPARTVRLKRGATPSYNASPIVLAPSVSFQIVAPSPYGKNMATEVGVTVFTEADCSSGQHPLVMSSLPNAVPAVATSQSLKFFRDRVDGDQAPYPDFLMLLNCAFGRVARTHTVQALSCGVPVAEKGLSSQRLAALVEVFPADAFKVTLTIPALLLPERFGKVVRGAQTEDWKSRSQRRVDEAGSMARPEYRAFAKDLQRKQIEREKADELATFRTEKQLSASAAPSALATRFEGLEIELSVTDGTRERTANPETILSLIKLIRDAEYRFKQISEWVDGLQLGLGASIEIECQFLVLSLTGEWGYKESSADHRVFMGMRGEVECDVMAVTVTATFGWRALGAADLYVKLTGSGKLSLAASVERTDIGQPLRRRVTPQGKISLQGELIGEVGWTAKVKGGISVDFTTDVSRLQVFSDDGFWGGELAIQRSAVTVSYTASFAGIWDDTDSAEMVQEDKRAHVFTFS